MLYKKFGMAEIETLWFSHNYEDMGRMNLPYISIMTGWTAVVLLMLFFASIVV